MEKNVHQKIEIERGQETIMNFMHIFFSSKTTFLRRLMKMARIIILQVYVKNYIT